MRNSNKTFRDGMETLVSDVHFNGGMTTPARLRRGIRLHRRAAVVAALFGAWTIHAGTTYYFNASEASSSNNGWNTPSKWSTSYTADDGNHPDAFTSEDDFVVPPRSSGFTLRTPLSTKAEAWHGHSLRVGGEEYAVKNTSIAVIRHATYGLDSSVTYENAGLILARRSRYIVYCTGTNRVFGTVTVTGDKDYPANLRSSQVNSATLIFCDAFKGGADAYTVVDSDRTNAVFTLRNTADYFGTLLVSNYVAVSSGVTYSGSRTQVRFENDCPGSIALTQGTTLALDANLTVGNLTLGEGSAIDLGVYSLTLSGNLVHTSAKVKVVVDPTVFPGTIDVLKGAAGAFAKEDFELFDTNGNLLDIDELSVIATEAGIALRAVQYPTARLLVTDSISRTSAADSSMTNKLNWTNDDAWSDAVTMPSGWRYLVQYEKNKEGSVLRSVYGGTLKAPTGNFVFPGEALTFANGATFVMLTPSFFCKHLVLDGASIYPTAYSDTIFTGRVTVKGRGGAISQYSSYAAEFQAEIDGTGELKVSGVSGASSSSPFSYVKLLGLNTNFTGSVLATMPLYSPADPVLNYDKITPRFDRNFVHLIISDKRNLGGPLAYVNPKALTLENMSRLELDEGCSGLVLDESTRGVFIRWIGRFLVGEGKTMTIASPLAFDGTLWKEGDGMLVLANPAPTYGPDATSTEPAGDSTNHLFRVAGGDLKIASVDAVNGLNVVFTNGAKRLIVDLVAQSGEFKDFGIRNVKTDNPFALEEGLSGLTLAFESETPPTSEFSGAVFTVKKECYDSVAAIFNKREKSAEYKGWRVNCVRRDNVDGETATMIAEVKRTGLVLVVR